MPRNAVPSGGECPRRATLHVRPARPILAAPPPPETTRMSLATLRRFALATTLATLAAACGGDDPNPVESGFGTVRGKIVAADGNTPLPGAIVKLVSGAANGPV